jgi:hypothetical protein
MRPTYLEFRSPKEKTPDAYNPAVTIYGKRLGFSPNRLSGTFSQSKRFQQYEIDAKRTGFRIGPGSYENPKLEIVKPKKGGPVYKAFHGSKDVSNNGYFYTGHSLVFEPSLVLKSKKSRLASSAVCVEFSPNRIKRPSSAKPNTESKSTNFSSTPNKRPVSANVRMSPFNSKLSTEFN